MLLTSLQEEATTTSVGFLNTVVGKREVTMTHSTFERMLERLQSLSLVDGSP